jgi:hypothetical protein
MGDKYSEFPESKNKIASVNFKDVANCTITKLRSCFSGMVLVGSVALAMAACGGGGGGSSGGGSGTTGSAGSSLVASFTGSAVDAPIAYAQITFTSGAPLNDPGATLIGTFTANASGVFSSTVTLPSSDVPVFGNAVDPNNSAVILSSYLGQSTALASAAASGVLTSSNLPDLDITPVTTAALAVFYQVNGSSYTSLTPTTYSTNLQQYNGDILAIASAIKAVGDNLCTPGITVNSTTNLAASIAANSSLTSGNSTTLATAASTLGGNCATVLANLPQQISADPTISPGLYIGDVIDVGVSGVVSSVPSVTTGSSNSSNNTTATAATGTYTLEGVIAESGWNNAASAVTANPAGVFNDSTVTVDASGNITSTDSNVSGTLVGNLVTLTLTNGSQQYSLRGKIGVLPTTQVSGGTAYSLQGGGTNTSTNELTNFNAVLAPIGVAPIWNGNTAPTSTACATGAYPIGLNVYGSGIGGGGVIECIVASATGWTMTASTQSVSYMGDNAASSIPPSLSASTWNEVSATSPFILSANASFTSNGVTTTGTMYYVMGTASIVFTSSLGNSLFCMQGNSFTQLAESVINTTSTNTGNGSTGNSGNDGNTAASGVTGNADNNGNQTQGNYH